MSAAMAAFWLTTGSFAGPLIVLGALVIWLNRRGIAPPRSTGWLLVAWSGLAAVIVEPAPWLLLVIAGGLLVAGPARPTGDATRGGKRQAAAGQS
jgi:hypothetical protein